MSSLINKLFFSVIATLLVLVLGACGGLMEEASTGDPSSNFRTDSRPRLDLIHFSNSSHVPREFELGWSSGEICRSASSTPVSSAITKIIAGGHWRRSGINDPWELAVGGESIRPCNTPVGEDPAASLQSLVQKLNQLHSTIPGLRPVTIELFPVFENDDNGSISYATDDAFYDASRETIVLLPPSSVSPRTRLWESAFILAHEIAHHAIITKFKIQMQDWCEEGNADLMAFQMIGEDTRLIRELPGFGSDRDPSWAYFSDGVRKSEMNLEFPTSIHRKGAAFAHQAWLKQARPIHFPSCDLTNP
jgi:hypothetical protein